MSDVPAIFPSWLERMFPPGMRRSLVDVGDGLRMHVAEWGAGRPVLLLHGNPAWGFLWRRVVADLRREPGAPLRLVVPDLVGLGCSDKPRDPRVHTLENHARWTGAVLDALDLEDLVFVGQDWGGPIGMSALAPRMGRLAGLVVLNTVLGPPREGFEPTAFHRLAQTPLVSDLVFRLGFPQNTMTLAQGDKRSILGRTRRGYLWPLRKMRDRVAPLALARMVPDAMDHPSIAALRACEASARSFEGPTAIVWGDRDPVLGRVIGHMCRMLPRASVTRTRAGHFLQEEVPREIADGVRDVVARI